MVFALHRRTNFFAVTLILFLGFICISYLWLSSISSEFYRPSYELLPLPGLSQTSSLTPTLSAETFNSEEFEKFTLLPSFFVTSGVARLLSSDDYYYARLFAQFVAENTLNVTDTFHCICGRISDVCSCCGVLHTCAGFPEADALPAKLCKPVILHSVGDEHAASFCLNLTYIPAKQQVRTSGFLVPRTAMTELENIKTALPRFNRSRILFADVFVSLNSPPVYCVENSRTDPDLAICHQLKDLKYAYDPKSDHKTVFTGCADVSIWFKRRYKIIGYREFCFKAHRGASGDLDKFKPNPGPVVSKIERSVTNSTGPASGVTQKTLKPSTGDSAHVLGDIVDAHAVNP